MTLSTAEAEYVALSSAAQESVWMRGFSWELGTPPDRPITIFKDNQSAIIIAMAKNTVSWKNQIQHHFERDGEGKIKLTLPDWRDGTDILTKGLIQQQFWKPIGVEPITNKKAEKEC